MADEDLGDVLNNLDTINKAKAATLKKDGDTFYRQGFYDAALNSFNEALLLDLDNPDVLNSKGLTLVKLGKIDEAKAVEKKRAEMLEKLHLQPGTIPDRSTSVSPPTGDLGIPVPQPSTPDKRKKPEDKEPIYHGQKNPVLAAVLSLLWPGLGQAYNGHYVKAVLVMAIELAGILLLFIPTLIAWVYSIVDAYLSAKKIIRGDLPLHKTNVGYMVVFAIIPIILIIMGSLISAGVFHKPGLGPLPPSGSRVPVTPHPTSNMVSFFSGPNPLATPAISSASLDQVKNSAMIPPYTTLFKNNINDYKGEV